MIFVLAFIAIIIIVLFFADFTINPDNRLAETVCSEVTTTVFGPTVSSNYTPENFEEAALGTHESEKSLDG